MRRHSSQAETRNQQKEKERNKNENVVPFVVKRSPKTNYVAAGDVQMIAFQLRSKGGVAGAGGRGHTIEERFSEPKLRPRIDSIERWRTVCCCFFLLVFFRLSK